MDQSKENNKLLDKLLGEASWLISHAQALADYGKTEEVKVELEKAANYEEEAAFLLDAIGRQEEATLHRVSAATCHEQLSNYPHAVTLLWATLAGDLTEGYRLKLENQIEYCIAQANPGRGLSHDEGSSAHRV